VIVNRTVYDAAPSGVLSLPPFRTTSRSSTASPRRTAAGTSSRGSSPASWRAASRGGAVDVGAPAGAAEGAAAARLRARASDARASSRRGSAFAPVTTTSDRAVADGWSEKSASAPPGATRTESRAATNPVRWAHTS
jgi:hypothetical protein